MTHQWVTKNLYVGSELGYATGSTRDWVAKQGSTVFEI